MCYTSRSLGIVSIYNSSSDYACLSIYGQVLKFVSNMSAFVAYSRLFHSSGSVHITLTSAPATTLSVPPDYGHSSSTFLVPLASVYTSSLPSHLPVRCSRQVAFLLPPSLHWHYLASTILWGSPTTRVYCTAPYRLQACCCLYQRILEGYPPVNTLVLPSSY